MDSPSSFHAHHSPMGAHSTFTIGNFGMPGGMATEKSAPNDGCIFVGYKDGAGTIHTMPFYRDVSNDAERYTQNSFEDPIEAKTIEENAVSREYNWSTDRFSAKNIELTLFTPFSPIPDPASAEDSELKYASCPATLAKLVITNDSEMAIDGFFALNSTDYWTPVSHGSSPLKGATTRSSRGFATADDVEEFSDFSVDRALSGEHKTPRFLLGTVAGIRFKVEPGESRTIWLSLAYYLEGVVTFNKRMRYFYTKYFSDIESVFEYSLANRRRYVATANANDAELRATGMSEAQQFLLAHATRSYYGSTQWLLNEAGESVWVVQEGEYLMLNTLDLTVDMLFFELRMNPWTVRNVLEQFVNHYAYTDQVFSPNQPDQLFDGGISFCHDMGVANHFSPDGHSSYECAGLDRLCFSYMTCEQLTNWVLCAGVYYAKTGDLGFIEKHQEILTACYNSLVVRDNPDPALRNGLMSFESSRTEGGGEITTYDSLDHSLGQARANVYLAGKCWASYVALEYLFNKLGLDELAQQSAASALTCSQSIAKHFDEELGYIPAVLEGDNRSAIIPAVEALVYPYEMGLTEAVTESGPYSDYIVALKKHTRTVLQPGVCLYPDNGGWKLSSTADNTWMSKICLNQYIIRQILKLDYSESQRADDAHMAWQVEGSRFHACSDQFSSGKPIGSLYYPRIVTNILWLKEKNSDPQSFESQATSSELSPA